MLAVGLYNIFGLSIGTWGIIIGLCLIVISLILDRTYVRILTYVNVLAIGVFVDFFLWLDFLPKATYTWKDPFILIVGIVIMGIGGGLYNAVRLGAGPRDGFMLSISDKTGSSIRIVCISTESFVLLLGLLIGGPIFIFSFLFTFIQSPVFQLVYENISRLLQDMEQKSVRKTRG